jgi:hypothetical protein
MLLVTILKQIPDVSGCVLRDWLLHIYPFNKLNMATESRGRVYSTPA